MKTLIAFVLKIVLNHFVNELTSVVSLSLSLSLLHSFFSLLGPSVEFVCTISCYSFVLAIPIF